jgi:hypothetical protein
MNNLDIITRAIELRKGISFEYVAPGKVTGQRFGNPHCLFLHPTTNNLMVHVFQISGVSETKEQIPGWRSPLLNYMENIIILEEADCFEIADGYKPNSTMYTRIISKV